MGKHGTKNISNLYGDLGKEEAHCTVLLEEGTDRIDGFALGVLPALDVDGKQYGQSIALAAFLARQFGFHGKTNIEILEVDQVIGILGDIFTELTRAMREPNEARKAEILKENEVNLPRYLGFLEKILKNNKTGFFVGNKLGFADVATFDALDNRVKSDVLGRFPLVQANIQKVRTNDRISKWLAKRPETPM